MNATSKQEERIEALDSELLTRLRDLIDRGQHDAARFSEIMNSMKDRPENIELYASDGTLSTACDSVIYYAEKLKQLALCFETSKKIQTFSSEKDSGGS